MADLKIGSTVGGSQIWTQSSFPAQPSGQSLFYNGHRVFTSHDKPSAIDVDAVSASKGGEYLKSVHFAEGLTVGSASAGDTKKNGIFKGKSDAANFDGVSWELRSWWSIGFVNARDNTIKAYIDTTSGNFDTKGSINGRTVMDNGRRVYSPVNKPSAEELGFVALTDVSSAATYDRLTGKIPKIKTDGGINLASHIDLHYSGSAASYDARMDVHAGGLEFTATRVNFKCDIFVNNNKVYHAGNKPTKADVGLGNVTNDAQVKKSGDTMTGNLTVPKVFLTTDPVNGNEAVRLSYFDKLVTVASSQIIGADTDWNTIIKRGVYRVNGASGNANPTNGNAIGTLVVLVPGDPTQDRLVQVFYPVDAESKAISIRSKDGAAWKPWSHLDSRALADARYVNTSGDTMTGILTVPNNHGGRTLTTNYNGEDYFFSFFSMDGRAGITRRSSTHAVESLFIDADSNLVFEQCVNKTQSNARRKVYHENFKPTATDVQAVPLNAVIDFGTF